MLFVDIYLLGAVIDWFVCTPLHFCCTFPIQNVLSQLQLSPHCDIGQVSSGVMGRVYCRSSVPWSLSDLETTREIRGLERVPVH